MQLHATQRATTSPLTTVPQPRAEWDAGYSRPYGPGISTAQIQKAATANGVRVEEGPFPGSRLFVPVHGGTGATLLFLHGSEGGAAGYADMSAMYYAAAGFTTMSYAYFGVPGRPRQLAGVSVDDVLEAARYLQGFRTSNGRPIGIVGASRGAELALIAASHAPKGLVGAVAAHSPQGVAVRSFAIDRSGNQVVARGPDGTPQAAWAWNGVPIADGTPTDLAKLAAPVFLSVGTADDVW
ncbi:MAG: hydrolase of the alpha/beta superfamily, partial [Thermoleophilia bacterium]|nr:hydrolase of the alpha/beta superfamily [Thermoleophilia bacterium]